MYLLTSNIITIAMVGVVFAQNSTVSLYIPGANPSASAKMSASVVNSDTTATTYALQCAPTDREVCGFDIFALTEGPATAKYTIAPEKFDNGSVAFTASTGCSLAGTTSAVCVESNGGPLANFPGVQTRTYSGTDVRYQAVVITAGPGETVRSSSSSSSSWGFATSTSPSKAAGATAAVTGNGRVLGGAAVALAMVA